MVLPFWDIVDAARGCGAVAVHCAPGHGPMMRMPGRELLPVPEPFDAPTADAIAVFLSGVVEPERWRHLEDMGSGEVRAGRDGGDFVRLSLFKSANGWTIVARL